MSELVSHADRAASPASPLHGLQGAKPQITADRFRALTERLKKPAGTAIPATTPAPSLAPAIAAQVAITPAPPIPDFVAPPPVAEAVPSFEVEAPVVAEKAPEPIQPILQETPPAIAPAPEPPQTKIPATIFGPSPFAKPVEAKPAVSTEESLQRRLSGLLTPLAPAPVIQVALPEILPPPPPPPPPEVIADLTPDVAPPSMEQVQQRLREDATARLEQLDIENIWRQALSTPTLEERAQFLREAAEWMAEEGLSVESLAPLPPEHDLSQIAPAPEGEPKRPEFVDKLAPDPELPSMSADEAETAEVARSLLDMMSAGTSSGLPQERALAADTLLRLLPKLAVKPLVMLAERMSIMENPPHLIVGRLIRDPRPEVSGPLLENCMHVSESDLLTVVAEDNPGKRRLLARRRKLSGAVSSALIATGDPSVLLTLVRNANAEISHDGFAALIENAENAPDILAPMSTRADLSAPYAFELFWKSPPQLRRYLLSRFLTDSETLTKILKITLSTQGEEAQGTSISPGEMIEALDRACKGRMESSAEKIAEAVKVGAACIQRVLADKSGEAIVVVLKVAGFPRNSVGDVLRALKNGDLPLLDQDRDVEELQVMFDTLSTNKARILLTYWDWAVKKSGPYAPVH